MPLSSGQAEIGHEQVDRARGDALPRLCGACGTHDLEPELRKTPLDDPAHGPLVLDDEHRASDRLGVLVSELGPGGKRSHIEFIGCRRRTPHRTFREGGYPVSDRTLGRRPSHICALFH